MAKKNVTVAAAAVAVLLAAGYPASSWYFGRQIQAAHAEIDAKIAAVPYLKLVSHDYQRSLFDATETVTIEIPLAMFHVPPIGGAPAIPSPEPTAPAEAAPDAPQAAQPAQAPAPLPPLRITLKTSIQHGPFPGFNALAAGSATTVIEFDDPIQKKVLEAFGGKQPMDIRTVYDFQGGGRSTVTSPAFKLAMKGQIEGTQATLSGDGLQTAIEFTRSMERYSMRGDAPRFELSDPNGPRLTMTGMRIEADQQRLFADDPLLYAGSQLVSIAALEIDPGAEKGQKIALKEMKYDVQLPVAGEFVDLIAKFGAGEVRVGEQNYGPAAYDFSLKHLHARKLAALNRDFMALYSKPEALQDPQQLMQSIAPMKDKFVALLLDNPVLSLDRIAFRLPEGEAKISASVRLIDAKAEDFAIPMMLIAKLEAAADVALPAALATTLAAGKEASEEEVQMRKQGAEQSIANLVQQGYAANENGVIKSRIAFKGGQLLVNDKPFNPMMMALEPVEPLAAK